MYGFTEVCYILPDQLALATPFWNLLPHIDCQMGKPAVWSCPVPVFFFPDLDDISR